MIQFTILREQLLIPLQAVIGVVEKRQTMAVLSNVLLKIENNILSITGSDKEIELIGRKKLDNDSVNLEITVPGRKLYDIVKSLSDGDLIRFELGSGKLIIKTSNSRFLLSTIDSEEFPNIDFLHDGTEYKIPENILLAMINATAFAMAQQDVRYFLNGMLLEFHHSSFKCVATDGHRLAYSARMIDSLDAPELVQIIIPRKGILELSRLLQQEMSVASIYVNKNHVRVVIGDIIFTTKLVDGKFPDYKRVIPMGGTHELIGNRLELKSVLQRASILSNEKYRGIRLLISSGRLVVKASNPEQEEAEIDIECDYQGPNLDVGFNVSYLLDILNTVSGEQIKFTFSDADSSALISDFDDESSKYVVMPMRL